jgi:hypothetical protein
VDIGRIESLSRLSHFYPKSALRKLLCSQIVNLCVIVRFAATQVQKSLKLRRKSELQS